MKYISVKIDGIPYSRSKTKGNISAPPKWSDDVIRQTRNLPRISHACIMRITFLLPLDKYQTDFPYGPDLDNLAKRFLDALSKTIFSESKGKDSCVIEMNILKTQVDSENESGALLEILPIKM